MTNVLEVHDLRVDYERAGTLYRAVDGATLQVRAGETVGLVGESGSGKSTLALSAGGLLPGNARAEGVVRVAGRGVLAASRRELTRIRKKHIGFVFQSPIAALDPTRTVRASLLDVVADEPRAVELLRRVSLPTTRRILGSYPHQLSGGMAQRVAIALAIARDPTIVIADEPTASLDSSVRNEVLQLLFGLKSTIGASVLFLSHDIRSVGRFCERVCVMYGGRIVEDGPASVVLRRPSHPYTAALLAAVPGTERPDDRLEPIPGLPPILRGRSESCAFAARCRFANDRSHSERPEPRDLHGVTVICHRAHELELTPRMAAVG